MYILVFEMDFFVLTYLFRFYVQFQKKQDYKALHFNEYLAGSQHGGQKCLPVFQGMRLIMTQILYFHKRCRCPR